MNATPPADTQATALPQRRGSISTSRLLRLSPLLALLFVVFVINWPTLDDYFHGDDYLAFVDLSTKPALKHMEAVFAFKDGDVYWRPLGELYYLAIYSAFGLDVVAFHVANVSVFLLTLVFLHAFCMRAGFGRATAVGAAAIFGLYPNHVISVAWVTNGPRLLAVLFVLAGLVLLQEALRTRRPRYDALTFLAFALATLADEVALSLAPLAVLYPVVAEADRRGWLRRTAVRTLPYAALAGVVAPVQFLFGTKNDPGFEVLSIGTHVPNQLWALTAKLVLPLRDGVSFAAIPPEAWAAGAAAGVIAVPLLIFGSTRLRFLVGWVVLGLAPFTLWETQIAPARYVYMAAVPFAIIASWALVGAGAWIASTDAWRRGSRFGLGYAAIGATAVLVALLGGVFSAVTMERNEAFARDTETYRILAQGLPEALPSVPSNSRIVIYYGIWTGFSYWSEAVVRTTYRDRTLKVVNVPRGQVEAGGPGGRRPRDLIVYYTGHGFIAAAPLRQAATQ